jgi:hypothetical protein
VTTEKRRRPASNCEVTPASDSEEIREFVSLSSIISKTERIAEKLYWSKNVFFFFRPFFISKKLKEAYEFTLLSVCVSISVFPPVYIAPLIFEAYENTFSLSKYPP